MKFAIGSFCLVAWALSIGVAAAQKAPAFGPGPSAAGAVNTTPAAPGWPMMPKAAYGDKIDLNSAIWERLMDLPGVDKALAEKIIDGRPYKSPKELKERKIVPDATYSKIKNMVEAKKTKK